jgi:valyl-tRNA synthetase
LKPTQLTLSAIGHDTPFSDNQLKIGRRLVTKIWNAFRFIEEHTRDVDLSNFNTDSRIQADHDAVNEWLLDGMSRCFEQYERYFKTNEFGLALDTVEKFFWQDFCDNYLELIKDRLFNPSLYDAQQVEATRWTLSNVGLRILQLYAPYLPHITETVYGLIYKDRYKMPSIHQTKFSELQKIYSFEKSNKVMDLVIAVTNDVRKLKTQQQLSLRTELQTLTLCSNDTQIIELLKNQKQLLKGVTRTHTIEYATESIANEIIQDGELWRATVTIGPV